MDQVYSFSVPKKFEVITLTDGATPVRLKTVLGDEKFHPGTIAVQVQNAGDDGVFWAWASSAPSGVEAMGLIPEGQIIRFNWEEKDLNDLWVAGQSAGSKIVCMQEGK